MTFLSPKQREAVKTVTKDRGGIVFWRVGTGKTRVAITAGMKLMAIPTTMIAVICRRQAFYDWRQEIATLQLDWEVHEIEDINPETLFKRNGFVLVSDGLLRNPTIIATLQLLIHDGYLGAILIDEGYLFCNPQSQRSKGLAKISHQLPGVLVSGSIMPSRDLIQIYGQAYAANKHLAISPTATKFRQEYQKGIQGHYFAYYPRPGAYKKLMEKMAPFTSLFMPRKSDREWKESIIKIPPSYEQLEYLLELKNTYAIEGKFELKNAANIIQKGQQISNGWLKGEDGITYFESTKVQRCVALVEEILSSGEKVVIWCAYREDINRLLHAFDACEFDTCSIERKEIATLQGGEVFDTDAWFSGKQKICLATEASGSSINHFAKVPYGIYFSQDFKWLSLQQSQGRHDRVSSEHPVCYFTFLHTDKSPDARVYYTVRGAASSERSFIQQLDAVKWLEEI